MDGERRKEELAKKRQKLAELRRAREERKQVFSHNADPPVKPVDLERDRKEKEMIEVDNLVKALLADKTVRPGTPSNAEDSDGSDKGKTERGRHSISMHSQHSQYSPNTSVPQSPQIPNLNTRYIPDFSPFDAVILDIAPKEIVLYSKEVQTSENSFGPPPPSEEEIRSKILKELEEIERQERLAQEEQHRKKIVNSADFADFIDHTTKIIERALNENYDFMKDYSISKDNPELVVAAYNKNPIAMNEPDGAVLVWNLRLLERPEFIFHSQSDVLTVAFSDFHPKYVIGGTYSRQTALDDK
ncbi:2556_t:CDS:2, partial [Racocetra fulgida]